MSITSLEFYSGIGGMHYALRNVSPDAKVLAAFDINTTANTIYAHNFPETTLFQNNIEALSVSILDTFDAHLWTMSPPCQPFTKKGLQLGENDRRCDSLKALLLKLIEMKNPPRCILVENVVGFETSSAHDNLVNTLNHLNYDIKEYILSPIQFGVPNNRPRYYLLAKKCSSPCTYTFSISREHNRQSSSISTIGGFISSHSTDEDLMLPLSVLKKYGGSLDVISYDSIRSSCFTKSYGTYFTGCGSFFCPDASLIDGKHLNTSTISRIQQDDVKIEESPLAVRCLSPREVANLMCFPPNFSFPSSITSKQLYRTLGNSVNVRVISILINELLC